MLVQKASQLLKGPKVKPNVHGYHVSRVTLHRSQKNTH
jgi:hypothetical protein